MPLTAATEDGYRRVEFLAMNPELDDDGLGTAIHWDTYFGPDKERYYKAAEVDDATQKLDAHMFSIAALAGSLLQFAKQGIDILHGTSPVQVLISDEYKTGSIKKADKTPPALPDKNG